jgi:hypothetical protein
LFTPWLFEGGAVAFLIFLPNLVWNIQHHWPFLELMHNIRVTGKDIAYPPVAYAVQQILMINPFSLPFWIRGLLFYLFLGTGKKYRVFGWTFLITFVFFLISHGKDYYSAPAYPILLAAGAVAVENLLSRSTQPQTNTEPSKWRAALKPVCFAWLIVGVALVLPLVLPVLSLESFIAYKSHTPVEGKPTERSLVGTPLPQYYADELPWQEQVAAVARVYQSL